MKHENLRVYETMEEAREFARRVKYESGGVLELWPYRCRECGKYHTSGSFLEMMMKLKADS